LLDDCAGQLGDLVTAAMAQPSTVDAVAVLAALAGPATADPLTALRRMSAEQVATAVRNALDNAVRRADGRPIGFAALWAATGARPLATALAGLAPAMRERYPLLARLETAEPLPRSLRVLTRRPRIAPGRSTDVTTLRVRAALGDLVRAGDPVVGAAIAAEATTPALCALVTAVSLWGDVDAVTPVLPPRKVRVPGYPASSLADPDGPWQRAWPAARDLGAPVDDFWPRIAADGLVVPTAWLRQGGWDALWRVTAARSRRPGPHDPGRPESS
jgi:hypothetical protein